MWLPTAGDRVELRIYCYATAQQQIGINTVRMKIDTIGPTVDPIRSDDLNAALSAFFAPSYKALLDSSCVYLGTSMQLFPQRTFVADWSKEGAGAGSVVGNDAPAQVSGLITLRTNYAKRSGRGRLYIPFPSVTSNDTTGIPTNAYMVLLNQLAELFDSPIPLLVGPDTVAVTLHCEIDNANGTGIEKAVVLSEGVQKWATQRRRGSYGQKNQIPPLLA